MPIPSVSEVVARRPAAATRVINDRASLARALLVFGPVLEASPRLAAAFLEDPAGVLHAAGLRAEGVALDDLKAVAAAGGGAAGLHDVRFEPTRDLIQLAGGPRPANDAVEKWAADLATAPRRAPRTTPSAARLVAPPGGNGTSAPDPTDVSSPPEGGTPKGNPSTVPTLPTLSTKGSHSSGVNFTSSIGDCDVVIQLHRSFWTSVYNGFFSAEALSSIFLGGKDDPNVVEPYYTSEGWLLMFIQTKLTFQTTPGIETMTMSGAKKNEAAVRMRVTVTTSSRWTPSDPWEQTDTFTATVFRYGTVGTAGSITLAGSTLDKVLVADLAGGRSVMTLDDGPDAGREQLLGFALDGFFSDQLPKLLVSGTHQTIDPFVTWARMGGATANGGDDFGAVNWTYGPPGSKAFTDYILDHGRNLAVGMSAAAVLYDARAGLGSLPMVSGGTTLETVGFSLNDGYLEVIATGTRKVLLFNVGFNYSVRVTLALDASGNLVARADHSRVQLPAWLWFASGMLLGVTGLLAVSIANIVANGKVKNAVVSQIDLSKAVSGMLQKVALPVGTLSTEFDRVEMNPNGVFLKGNATVSYS